MNSQTQSSDVNQKPLTQSDLSPHQIAAAEAHARITGPDAPVTPHPETGELPLTASQIATLDSPHSGSPTSAATTGGSEDLAEENKTTTPLIGDMVRIHAIENGVAVARIAYVTSVSNLDTPRLGEDGEPYLTVVYMSSNDRKILGGADWAKAFTRVGPVHHESSASAVAGRESVYWTDLLPHADLQHDLDTDAADKVNAALKQRALHGQTGRGPVIDATVPAQGATATDAVAQGLMSQPKPENPASVAAERIHPPRTAVNAVPPAPVRSGLAGTAAPATAEQTSAQLHANAVAAGQQRHMTPAQETTGEAQGGQGTE
jgi:hypothetical protein